MARLRILILSACALIAATASAAQEAQPLPAPSVVPKDEVAGFYAARADAPIWFRDAATREAAARLPDILRRAPLDGLAEGPDLAVGVEAALARATPADDRILSAAWVRYVQTLQAPVEGMSYGDPALAIKPGSAADILSKAADAPSLTVHVDAIARVNPLYSALREAGRNASGAPDPRVVASLRRLRMIPAKGRSILVDSAGAELWMLEDGHPVDRMKVIVGRKVSPTPLIAGTIHYITLNPYWNIPADVARDKVAPLVLKRGVKYLKAARYVTSDGFGTKASDVASTEIDWKAVADGDAPVFIRQLPGGNNMMGAMKFGFVNDHDIFLHDTPQRKLFDRASRTFSMGCVRLEHAGRLARWLLGRDVDPAAADPETHVQLEAGVPIYLTYLTAKVEQGQLGFNADVYALDASPVEASETIAASR